MWEGAEDLRVLTERAGGDPELLCKKNVRHVRKDRGVGWRQPVVTAL